jgi:hypothetical protein
MRNHYFLLIMILNILYVLKVQAGEYICCFNGTVGEPSCQTVSFKKNKNLVVKYSSQEQAVSYCEERHFTHMRKYTRLPGKKIIALTSNIDNGVDSCRPRYGEKLDMFQENKGDEFATYAWTYRKNMNNVQSHQLLNMAKIIQDDHLLKQFLDREENCRTITAELDKYLGRAFSPDGELYRVSLSQEDGRVKALAIYEAKDCQIEIHALCATKEHGGAMMNEMTNLLREEHFKNKCKESQYFLESVPSAGGFYLKMGFECSVKDKKKREVKISLKNVPEERLRYLTEDYSIARKVNCTRTLTF